MQLNTLTLTAKVLPIHSARVARGRYSDLIRKARHAFRRTCLVPLQPRGDCDIRKSDRREVQDYIVF